MGAVVPYVSPAGLYPVRIAMVGSSGTSATGSYNSGTGVLTVTSTAHGHATGDLVNLDFGGGLNLDKKLWKAVTVTGANTYTIQCTAGQAAPASVTPKGYIRAAGRVGCTIAGTAVADQFTVTFSRAFLSTPIFADYVVGTNSTSPVLTLPTASGGTITHSSFGANTDTTGILFGGVS